MHADGLGCMEFGTSNRHGLLTVCASQPVGTQLFMNIAPSNATLGVQGSIVSIASPT